MAEQLTRRDVLRGGLKVILGGVGVSVLSGCTLGGLAGTAMWLARNEYEMKKENQQRAKYAARQQNSLQEFVRQSQQDYQKYLQDQMPIFCVDHGWRDGCNGGTPDGTLEKCEIININTTMVFKDKPFYVHACNYGGSSVKYMIKVYSKGQLTARSEEVTIDPKHYNESSLIETEARALRIVGFFDNEVIGVQEVDVVDGK